MAVLFIFFCLAIFHFVSNLSFSDTSWFFDEKTRFKLELNAPLLQKFIADKNNLSRIEIIFSNYQKEGGGDLQLKIMDSGCVKTLREKNLSFKLLHSDKPLEFIFQKIPDSQNKVFCLSVSFIPQNGKGSVKIYLSQNPRPQSISLYDTRSGKEIENRSLAMRPAYQKENLWQNIQTLNQRISQYKPWFLKKYYLASIIIAFIILSLVLVCVLITL